MLLPVLSRSCVPMPSRACLTRWARPFDASAATGSNHHGMEIFNYVMVLASVVIGLALTHLLQGAARIVQHPRRYNAYWVHLVWAAYIFEYAALWWWYEFGFSGRAHWTFGLYGFILLYS